jgi:outer membrane lipoprotein-sorting protein
VDGYATHRLRLTPKQRSSYRAAVLWIDTDVPVLRRIRMDEENETIRTITLSGVELDPEGLDDAFFTFTPPPGTEVISR